MPDADIPAKHQSARVLCAADTDAVCRRRSTSLLSLLQHTLKTQHTSRRLELTDSSVPIPMPMQLADCCCGFCRCDWNQWYCSVQFVTVSLAVLFLADADVNRALLLRRVYSRLWEGWREYIQCRDSELEASITLWCTATKIQGHETCFVKKLSLAPGYASWLIGCVGVA